MGNLNCNNSTIDLQNEKDFNRNKTYVSKNHLLQIISPPRNMKRSKTSSPKSHLSLKEKNFIFENIKNKESKNNKKIFRRSFTPQTRNQFKISPEINISNKKEENKKIEHKIKKNKEKESKDNEENDINKKGVILKKGKSTPLEVISEQIEDEKKVLDTTRNLNNNSVGITIKNNDKTQKEFNNKENLNRINNSNYYSDKSENDNNINENYNNNNSIIKKKEIGLYFNHTNSSKGEEDYKQDNNIYNNEIINNNDYINFIKNNSEDFEDKDFRKNLKKKEDYKYLYKKKCFKNKYYQELNWRNIKINNELLLKNEKDVLLQGEFLVFNNILEINSLNNTKYYRYLTLAKHEINIFRSREKYIYNKNPLINISLFNISKCDLLNKNDINMFINLKSLLFKYSLYIKLTTVTGMIVFESTNNNKNRYRFSNPFIKSNINKPKSVNKFTNTPKDIELIIETKEKSKINSNNINIIKNETNNVNNNKNKNKSGLYIIISSDNCELILNFVAIINYLRK